MSLAFAAEDQLAGMLHNLRRSVVDSRFDTALNLHPGRDQPQLALVQLRRERGVGIHLVIGAAQISRRSPGRHPAAAQDHGPTDRDLMKSTAFLSMRVRHQFVIIGTDLGRSGSRKTPIWATRPGKGFSPLNQCGTLDAQASQLRPPSGIRPVPSRRSTWTNPYSRSPS